MPCGICLRFRKGPSRQPNYLTFRPGVSLERMSDGMGQTYQGVERGDIYIVGRGLYQGKDIFKDTIRYKEACYGGK